MTSEGRAWFRTREGRRYAIEIGLIIAVKLAALALFFFVLAALWPHRAVNPAAVVRQYYAPPAAPSHHD
jgi:hypothetical protein